MDKEKRILPAKSRRQISAYRIDLVIRLLFFLAGYYSTLNLFQSSFHVKERNEERISFALDSHLVYSDRKEGILSYSKNNLKEAEEKENGEMVLGYQVLEEKVFSYYTEFMVKDNRVDIKLSDQTEAIKKRNREIYQLGDKENSNPYYRLQRDSLNQERNDLYPILKEEVKKKIDQGDTDRIHQLYVYYLSENRKGGIYDRACLSLYQQTYRTERRKRIDEAAYYSRLPYGIVFPFLFFLLLPLLSKEEKTIGKRMLHLSVLDEKSGEKAKKRRVFLHYAPSLLCWLRILALPYWYRKIVGLVLLLIDCLFRMISKKKQSLHDLLSSTYVAYVTKEREFLLSHPRSVSARNQIKEITYDKKEVSISPVQEKGETSSSQHQTHNR